MSISAYKQKHNNISIEFTIYSTDGSTTKRSFHIRNLVGTEDEQVEQTQQIMDEVAKELYYLTGFGIDKGVIRVDSKKVTESTYPDLTPSRDHLRFVDTLLIKFTRPSAYYWRKDNEWKWSIKESEIDDGWEIKARPFHLKKASFSLPVISRYYRSHSSSHYSPFFVFQEYLSKKRKSHSIEFSVTYNKEDPIFACFIARFYEDGNLSFGKNRLFGSPMYHMTGRWSPESKAKSDKYPRKSRLASQPTDDTEYVYFIRMGRTNIYKIGKSNDPQGRLASLQTANPYKLKLLHAFTADNASAAEETLHHLLHKKRMEGEWFRMTTGQKDVVLSIEHFKEGKFLVDGQEVELSSLGNS